MTRPQVSRKIIGLSQAILVSLLMWAGIIWGILWLAGWL